MIKQKIGFAIIMITAFFATSCSTQKTAQKTVSEKTSQIVEANQDERLPNALLWKIEGNNLRQPSYLFGTIHMIPEDDFFYPTGTTDALGQAQNVMFEIDMDDMNDMGKMMGMLGSFMMTDGTELKNLISEEDYNLVKNHFENMGLPFMMVEKIKPMFLSVLANEDLGGGGFGGFGEGGLDMGASGIKSYEMELHKKAQNNGIDVGGLETLEFQMAMMDSIPYDVQAQGLVEAIKSQDSGDESFDKMVEMYKSQDIEAMIEMDDFEGEDGERFEDLFLTKRNTNWIPIMKSAMAKETTFFAVGAAHLAGANGVIRLLKKEGYELTPVTEATTIPTSSKSKKKKVSKI